MGEYTNFNRQYRLAAGPANESGFEVGAVDELQTVPLRVAFSLQKSDLQTQNTGKISIWNLNDQNVSVLNQKNCILSFRAGYGSKLPIIFAGIVSFSTTVYEGADRKTDIEVVDNLIAIRDTYISLSYQGKVNWKDIFDEVADQMGVAVSYSYNAVFADVENGYSYVGLAKNVLTKGCECCGLTWSIQNGVLQVKVPGDVMTKEVYVLSAESGLIGVPARVVISNEEETGTTTCGWDVEFFLNGSINIDDYIKLESATVTGFFRVYSLDIAGDTTGDWIEKARLLEIAVLPAVSPSVNTKFNKGDQVRVSPGAKTYTGGSLAAFVYTTVYTVLQVGGKGLSDDRIVIGLEGVVTAAVHADDLVPA